MTRSNLLWYRLSGVEHARGWRHPSTRMGADRGHVNRPSTFDPKPPLGCLKAWRGWGVPEDEGRGDPLWKNVKHSFAQKTRLRQSSVDIRKLSLESGSDQSHYRHSKYSSIRTHTDTHTHTSVVHIRHLCVSKSAWSSESNIPDWCLDVSLQLPLKYSQDALKKLTW